MNVDVLHVHGIEYGRPGKNKDNGNQTHLETCPHKEPPEFRQHRQMVFVQSSIIENFHEQLGHLEHPFFLKNICVTWVVDAFARGCRHKARPGALIFFEAMLNKYTTRQGWENFYTQSLERQNERTEEAFDPD